MTSTELKIGLNVNARPSSRVLKPPGGGNSKIIFGEGEVAVNAPRPKYNQQNSSNLNACMGSTDPNQKVEKLREEIECSKEEPVKNTTATTPTDKAAARGAAAADNGGNNAARGRVPPGGYSSGGFW